MVGYFGCTETKTIYNVGSNYMDSYTADAPIKSMKQILIC